MANFLSGLFNRGSVAPESTAGVPGAAVYGGYVHENEKESVLAGTEKYKTFSQILANTSIAAAGTRYFLNLASKAKWKFVQSESDTDGKFAELAEKMLTSDPRTPWHRIIRRAAMYRFYGFSIQEWTAKRDEEGNITFADVAPRPQVTIERWDVQTDGLVMGVGQIDPQTMKEIYLPREKLVYMVDDTLSDSPMGLGLFRHIVNSTNRLALYEQVEGIGLQTDLRGIPVGRGPFSEMAKQVESGKITLAQRIAAEKPLRDLVDNHVKSAKTGMLLDSVTYSTSDEKGTPSAMRQWEIELLRGGSTGFHDVAVAIERLNREIARTLGVEGLLLGGDGRGSHALSKDKTQNFFLVVDSTLMELRSTIEDDLLTRIWELNGFPPEMMPSLEIEAVRYNDVEAITSALSDMASAGAILAPDDPVIAEVRNRLGVPIGDSAAMETEISLGDDKDDT